MVWYNSFFGDHARVMQFFGIETVAEMGADVAGHGATEAGHGTTDQATAEHAAAKPGVGAIYMGVDNHVLEDAHHVPTWVKVSPFVAMLGGLILSWVFYIARPDLPGRLAAQQRPLYLFLLNKWYFDEIYDAIFVRPAMALGRFFWKKGDGVVIDGTLNGVAMGVIPWLTRLAGRAQSGYLFHYAFAMVLGMALLITWMTLGGGAE